MQSVPTAFNSVNFIFPFGILPSFWSIANFLDTLSLCFWQVTPTMYSDFSSRTDITNSGGFTQCFPLSFTEQRLGSNTKNIFQVDININCKNRYFFDL